MNRREFLVLSTAFMADIMGVATTLSRDKEISELNAFYKYLPDYFTKSTNYREMSKLTSVLETLYGGTFPPYLQDISFNINTLVPNRYVLTRGRENKNSIMMSGIKDVPLGTAPSYLGNILVNFPFNTFCSCDLRINTIAKTISGRKIPFISESIVPIQRFTYMIWIRNRNLDARTIMDNFIVADEYWLTYAQSGPTFDESYSFRKGANRMSGVGEEEIKELRSNIIDLIQI
jgi:hypothetical protein